MARHLQGRADSAFSTAVHGVHWTMEAQLAAEAVDALRVANWQRAGRKHAPKPKRLPRPWEAVKATILGKGAIPISGFNDWWDSHKPKRRRTKKPPTA